MLMLKLIRMHRTSINLINEKSLLKAIEWFYEPELKDQRISLENRISKGALIANNAWLIFLFAYVGGHIWYRFSDYIALKIFEGESEERYFVNVFGMDHTECMQDLGQMMSVYDRIIRCMYFMLTTLSTVGYGVYTPQSLPEKIAGCLI